MGRSESFVIPAKAGIYRVASATHIKQPAFQFETPFALYARYRSRWIPAFAGMTVVFTFFILLSPALASPRLHSTSPPAPMPPLVFEDGNGAQHALSDYRGQFVLLNLWATWCAPCAREMPSLDALQKNFDLRRLTVLPLSEDRGDATVGAFYRSRGLSHLPIALDTAGRALSALHLHGLPTSILINPQGDEVARAEGEADWTSPEEMGVLQAQMGN